MLSCYGRDILCPFANAARAVSGRKGGFPEKERDPVIYGCGIWTEHRGQGIHDFKPGLPALRA